MESRKKRRIIVKVGTSTLTNEDGRANLRRIEQIARVLSDVHNSGNEVILVTSGAIAIGANKLRMAEKPTELRYKQAAAAVGQVSVMYFYDKFFKEYDQNVAQILFNSEDIENEQKKENLTNTFMTLLEMGIIPIVNENDSVSYMEIEDAEERLFSDNDRLSAVISVFCGADLLIILSDIDGFYDRDPRLYPGAKLIPVIGEITEDTYRLAGGAGSRRGTGGMRTKLQAAELVTAQGADMVVTNGKNPDAIYDILAGRPVGTLFRGRKR